MSGVTSSSSTSSSGDAPLLQQRTQTDGSPDAYSRSECCR
jgi:hypothetical protein